MPGILWQDTHYPLHASNKPILGQLLVMAAADLMLQS